MKEMGYEVITKTPKGSPRVHPIVRIVDGGKNFRLDKLGEYYELDSIKQRIQNNYRRQDALPRGGGGHESTLLSIQGESKEGHRPLRPVPILLL